jgi:hypothetical protein
MGQIWVILFLLPHAQSMLAISTVCVLHTIAIGYRMHSVRQQLATAWAVYAYKEQNISQFDTVCECIQAICYRMLIVR